MNFVFQDKHGKRYFPNEIVFCDIDTPGPQFLGYVTLDSFNATNRIDDWVEVEITEGVYREYDEIFGHSVVKGVKYHHET